MSKLGEDNYKRPKKMFTDKLTDDDINKLEDYVEEDISVPLNFCEVFCWRESTKKRRRKYLD